MKKTTILTALIFGVFASVICTMALKLWMQCSVIEKHDQLLVDERNRYEKLAKKFEMLKASNIPIQRRTSIPPSAADSPKKVSRPSPQPRKPAPTVTSPANPIKHQKGRIYIAKAYKEKLLGPMFGRLLGSARVDPVTSAGKISGYQFKTIRPNSEFNKLGLRKADIIRSVNGYSLSDPSKAMMLLQTLRNQRRIVVQLLRSGRPITLQIFVE